MATALPAARPPSKSGFFARIRKRLRDRPDTEHEIAGNRLMLCGVIAAFLFVASMAGEPEAQQVLRQSYWMFFVYNALSLALLTHLLFYPGVSLPRRCAGVVIDFWVIAAFDSIGDDVTGYIYPLYLWTIFGNGFRYGLPFLFISTVAGVTAFVTVVVTGSFWQDNYNIAVGMLVGLAILPGYVGLLIHKVTVARRQAEEASRAKSMFLAGVSHELRTPLTAILGLAGLLRDSKLDREQSDMVRTIGSSGRGLLRLINSLLDVSQAQIGRAQMKMTRLDLHMLLTEVRDMLSVQARDKGLHLALHITADTPRFVCASERHLQEALINLTSNAVKFTEKGFVLLFADRVAAGAGKSRLRFEIQDSGIGVPKAAQARIFEAFTQADETIIDRFGGTGLGLAIARQLVEAQDGEIGVISQEGKGSTFWFEIDVVPEVAPAARARRVRPAGAPPAMVLSADQSVFAALDRVGLQTRQFDDLDDLEGELARRARADVSRPLVFVDETALGCDLEAAAERLTGAASRHRATLVGVAIGADAQTISPAGRRLFATCLPRPLSDDAVANVLETLDGVETAEGTPSTAKRAASGKRVLVAEDNRTNQMVIARILENAGHDVELASDGDEAVERLLLGHFQIALMDINMPGRNGIDATKE